MNEKFQRITLIVMTVIMVLWTVTDFAVLFNAKFTQGVAIYLMWIGAIVWSVAAVILWVEGNLLFIAKVIITIVAIISLAGIYFPTLTTVARCLNVIFTILATYLVGVVLHEICKKPSAT